MAELRPFRVAGDGGNMPAEIFAFSGLYFGGERSSRCLFKEHPLFQLSFPSKERREKGTPFPVSALFEKVWRRLLTKYS